MKKPLLLIGTVLGASSAVYGAHEGQSSHALLGATGDAKFVTPGQAVQGRQGAQVQIDISGTQSWDVLGDPSNTVMLIDLAAALGKPAGSQVVMNGIGYHTVQSTVGASWLSEMRMYFDDNVAPDLSGLFLTPGFATGSPGTGTYDSGGVLKLADVAIPDIVLPNGILRIEFYEGFDDVADAVDGNYLTGSVLTIQTTNTAPAPGALALLGLAGLVGGRRRRS